MGSHTGRGAVTMTPGNHTASSDSIAYISKSGKRRYKPTFSALVQALEIDDNYGFCLGCGIQVGGVEPDAERYKCENCGNLLVFGAEQLLIRGLHGLAES